MAKGLRSSSKKANRTKLRARVFQPVEEARLERLHQKLLETAQQPKPETAKEKEMDVDSAEGTLLPLPPPRRAANDLNLTCSPTDATATTGTKEEGFPKGSSLLTTPIPQSLLATSTSTPTPTPTPSCPPRDDATPDTDLDSDPDSHFYHLLSLSTSIHSFTPTGHLQLYFDPLPL